MTLREQICGESWWHGQDKKRHTDADLESIDKFTAAMELLHPGSLVDGGDGLTGIRGKSTDGDVSNLTKEEQKERNLVKHSNEEYEKEKHKEHGKNGHGSKNKRNMEKEQEQGGHGRHGGHGGGNLSMHDRAQMAMKDQKAHHIHDGPDLHLKNSHHHAHHGKKSAHDHGEEEKGEGGHHHHKHKNGGHSGHGRH